MATPPTSLTPGTSRGTRCKPEGPYPSLDLGAPYIPFLDLQGMKLMQEKARDPQRCAGSPGV